MNIKPLASGPGLISGVSIGEEEQILGHVVADVMWLYSGTEYTSVFVIKSKLPGLTVRHAIEQKYEDIDPQLARSLRTVTPWIVDECHRRELALYGAKDPQLSKILPTIYSVCSDEHSNTFFAVIELLQNVRHLDTIDNLDVWTEDDIRCAIEGMTAVHGRFLGQTDSLLKDAWILPFAQIHNTTLASFHRELALYCMRSFPLLIDKSRSSILKNLLSQTSERWRDIALLPLTLIHGDLTPRNICLKENNGKMQLCAYDWELAQIHLPQRDVIELLVYIAKPKQISDRAWLYDVFCNFQDELDRHSGCRSDQKIFLKGMQLAGQEFATSKLLVQGVTHQLIKKETYFRRIVDNTFILLEQLQLLNENEG